VRAERWPLSEREVAGLMDALCFDYFKWDVDACGRRLVLAESLVLTETEHQRVVAICERFDGILARLEDALFRRPDLLRRLGIPATLLPLLRDDPGSGLQLARYDVFLTPDGRWMVSEFNEDAPGGFNEADGLPALLGPSLRGGGAGFRGDLRAAVVGALRPYPHVALFYATGYAEDLQHVLIVRKWLEAEGHTTELASPSHLRAGWRGPRCFGPRCDAAFRFYPGEWFQYLANLEDWRRAAPRLPMMNPLRRLLRQSKRLYAFWRDPDLLPAEDVAFIEEHTPATRPLEDVADEGDRARWVLKNAFGRMGDAVTLGGLVEEKEWRETVAAARRAPTEWLLQERFEVAPVRDGGPALYPALGVYLVGGRFAGYYSRAAHRPYINQEAYHVATLVEPA